jgi:hypothetical protein
MRLVLPTLWSPSKTILVRFGGAEEKSAVTGVDDWESIEFEEIQRYKCRARAGFEGGVTY